MEGPVLVTGAGGFLGTYLCRALAARSQKFFALLSPTGAEPRAGSAPWPSNCFHRLDLRDGEVVGRLMRQVSPSYIFNLAAVGVSPQRPAPISEYVAINVHLPAICYEHMPEACILVHTGSMFQYRGGPSPIKERSALSFATAYHWSKNAADSLLGTLIRAAPRRKRCIRARLFGLIGGGERPHRLIPTIVAGCLAGHEIPLSRGDQIRDLLHAEDAADALLHVASTAALAGRKVNIGRGDGRTVRSVAERAAERLSGRHLLRFGALSQRSGEVQSLIADVSRLRSTGWAPSLSCAEAIDRAVDQLVADARGTRWESDLHRR